jgi:hypothetical protein
LNFAQAMTDPQESLAFAEQNRLTLLLFEATFAKAGVARSGQRA